MNLLLVSTATCILEFVLPILVQYILMYKYSKNKQNIELCDELKTIKKDMSEVSMIHEFAKYAKLQRRYNKLEGTLKEKVNSQLTSKMTMKYSITYVVYAINGCFTFILLYFYKNQPVIVLPKNILWPINSFLSWPAEHENCISLIMWIVIARLALSSCKIKDSASTFMNYMSTIKCTN